MSTRAEQVDFFVEDQAGPALLLRSLCRVVDRLWQQGPTRALVRVNDEAMLARLDDELWTFRDDAFIPHARHTGEDAPASPVILTVLGPEHFPSTFDMPDVFIDATALTPADTCAERFARIAVVLDGEGTRREAGRERFREWRRLGLTPKTHPLGR